MRKVSVEKISFKVLLLLMFSLFFIESYAQTTPGVALFWDKQVGCQKGGTDEKRIIYLENIEETQCLRVCDRSEVNYELINLPSGAVTSWTVVGGLLLNSSNGGCIYYGRLLDKVLFQ